MAPYTNSIVVGFLFWLIPFHLLATGAVFEIMPDTINLGVLAVGEHAWGNLYVSNTGDGTGELSLGSITGLGSNFIGWMSGMSIIIPSYSSEIISIPCYASAPGTIDATGTIYTSDPQIPVFYLHFIGTVVSEVFSLSGVITYPNSTNMPLNGVTVKLKDINGTVINTTTSYNSGYYNFSHVQNGNYTLEVSTDKSWGGVTALDVLVYKKHIAGISTLSGIYLASGDVNGSGTLTALDILLIRKRIAGISDSFPTGDWLFNNGPVTINDSNVTNEFNGICFGDANGSYVPPEVKGQE